MKTVTYDETKWKLVPIEPTPKMVDATFNDDLSALSHNKRNKHIYCAMIKAAPPYPDQSEQVLNMADQSGEVNEMVPESNCKEILDSWIPCSERLPEMGVPVLGLTNRVDIGAYLIADTGEGDGSWIWAAFEYGYISDPRMYEVDDEYIVDAWMPLPTVSKGEE